ncbi:suppressor of lurcher protein 1-like isoform X2 [Neocloeon triangulifer]|uniref:suppressor of lurcher protein 1-like isoform X2 n=1 Tax=Neocloeon triangulifer TaxID=2078957 RepID=UPI00286F0734|nr:suppressor of lurcher protein 1-like isoform X2 [Neocloeon triangulifer]XP_059476091.1 suppressor of lurcher protein 1-like isoform X2 [Neocloeon triangulifer]
MHELPAMQCRLVAFVMLLIVGGHSAVSPACECIHFTSTFGKTSGTFKSPDFPRAYDNNIECLLYSFVARRDQIVELTFRTFDVQKTHQDCIRGDHVKAFLHLEKSGEVNEKSSWSHVLCGELSDLPHRLFSTGHAAVLEFHTDHKPSNNSGFMGTFRFLDRRLFLTDGQKVPGTHCDYVFTSSNFSLSKGKFFSPRFPSSYPAGVSCNYRFTARSHERVRVVFEELNLQKGDVSCLEREDIVRVHDGAVWMAPVIAAECNQAFQLEVLSTGPDLLVRLSARSPTPGQGFRATFEFEASGDDQQHLDPKQSESMMNPSRVINVPNVSSSNLNNPPAPGAAASTTSAVNCDVLITSDEGKNGTIASPNYPQPYPSRSLCRYEFQGRGKERVQLTFKEFNLYHAGGDENDCESSDSLNAYVHLEGRSEKIDSFCGTNLPLPVMSSGSKLSLEFRGQISSRHVRGFQAFYSFTENFGISSGRQLSSHPCGFEFNSTEAANGTFSSPNYPGYYPRDTECHYLFYGRPGEKVHLHFTYFDVEGVLPCEATSASDYVEFSNYMSRDRKYSRYCGQLKGFEVESDKRTFRVTFRSNDRLDGTGFHGTYHFRPESEPNLRKPFRSRAAITSSSGFVLVLIVVLQCGGRAW